MKKFVLALLAALPLVLRAADVITPGAVWPDDRGQHIQTHGGGIIQVGDTWYWFGEDRSQDIPEGTRAVACYASKDLTNWQFRGRVLTLTSEEAGLNRLVLERPKVFHNAKTGKFVMYMHIDAAYYKVARVGVAVCDTVDGQYKFLRSFRPLWMESRDIGQFVDDDGSAYLIFESRPTGGFFIAKLSDDYLDVAESTCFIEAPLEGGAIVHYDGLYYLVGSALTGWQPNPNKYATAKSLAGPWSWFQNIAPPWMRTYGSQSTFLLKVVGSKKTSVIYLGDIWRPGAHWDGRYLWMPVEIGGGNFHLPEPRPWSIDVKTGEVTIAK
jgi:hypothetical protein